MNTTTELDAALAALKRQHKTNWMAFTAKVDGMLAALGARMGCQWSSTEDITEHVSADDFVAAGFTPTEAEAMIFVMTEDCMGQPVNNVEMIERWFCYCA